MFFPDRMKLICSDYKVLEIGPGADPHPRSDVLLEIEFESDQEYINQFGHERKLNSDKEIVFYSGHKFPFEDNSFDYVICSHVIEHVDDVPFFLSELSRVAPRGYLEYPLIYYEYLYNFDVHKSFIKWNGECMMFMNKEKSNLSDFKPVQDFFYQTLAKGHKKIIEDTLDYVMEGFEWEGQFKIKEAFSIKELAHNEDRVKELSIRSSQTRFTNIQLIKMLIKNIIVKIK